MRNFTGFRKEHVGEVVTDIIIGRVGIIESFSNDTNYPITVNFDKKREVYTQWGLFDSENKLRRLYFGDNIKTGLTGEEVPEPKLICPVCGVEHKVVDGGGYYFFVILDTPCPFAFSEFNTIQQAKSSMGNLINAMESKK